MLCASLGTIVLSLLYLPLPAAAGAGCLVLLQAWQALQLHAVRRHRDAVVALKFDGNAFGYQLRSGSWHSGAIMAGGLVTPWLTVVRISEESGEPQPRRRVLVICSDGLGGDDYRKLRVYLRWRWHAGVNPGVKG